VIYLDTHVAAWIYAGLLERIPQRARALMNESDLLISPMVALELQYLFETGRVTEPAEAVLKALRREVGLMLCEAPFAKVVAEALLHPWTRDPFDRVIVAQAAQAGAVLITKDHSIHQRYHQALWS